VESDRDLMFLTASVCILCILSQKLETSTLNVMAKALHRVTVSTYID